MRHNIGIRGEAFDLRPAELADASFIVALRNDPRVTRFIHPISPRVEDQQAWLERYFARAGDYYFVITRAGSGAPEGTVGIYEHDVTARSAEWGRWVIRPGSLAAVESALLVYRIAFEVLELEMVYCRTVAANQQVVSFHTASGLATTAHLPAHFSLGGVVHDAVEQCLTRARWRECAPRLAKSATRAARIVQRGG